MDLTETKAVNSKTSIGMKVLYESLERMSKEKLLLHEATKEHIIFISIKKSILGYIEKGKGNI